MCELLEKAILTVKKVWRVIIDKLAKKSVIAVLSVTGVHLGIAAVICNWVYDHYVITGNVGSVSDILIACFTGVISLATSLLLVIAVINLKEWKQAKEHENKCLLIEKISLFYLKCIRLRICEVKCAELRSLTASIKNNDSNPAEMKIYRTHEDDLFSQDKEARNLKAELSKIEFDIYHLTANINLSLYQVVIEFILTCRKNRVDFKVNLDSKYRFISQSALGSPRELPNVNEPKILKQYENYVTIEEHLASMEEKNNGK